MYLVLSTFHTQHCSSE